MHPILITLSILMEHIRLLVICIQMSKFQNFPMKRQKKDFDEEQRRFLTTKYKQSTEFGTKLGLPRKQEVGKDADNQLTVGSIFCGHMSKSPNFI